MELWSVQHLHLDKWHTYPQGLTSCEGGARIFPTGRPNSQTRGRLPEATTKVTICLRFSGARGWPKTMVLIEQNLKSLDFCWGKFEAKFSLKNMPSSTAEPCKRCGRLFAVGDCMLYRIHQSFLKILENFPIFQTAFLDERPGPCSHLASPLLTCQTSPTSISISGSLYHIAVSLRFLDNSHPDPRKIPTRKIPTPDNFHWTLPTQENSNFLVGKLPEM